MAVNFLFRCLVGSIAIIAGFVYFVLATIPERDQSLGLACGLLFAAPFPVVFLITHQIARWASPVAGIVSLCVIAVPTAMFAVPGVVASYIVGLLLTFWWIPVGTSHAAISSVIERSNESSQANATASVQQYVFDCRDKGFKDTEIKEQLLNSGWCKSEVEQALLAAHF
ncbi:MAG: hypothetical protein B9S32_09670 [Verrucomicrobia bacterium Tous-C9LFEB]|nr:MAG: hypothetical protein B9S32_09670 [Verrucomicrobia bacterium Tous-C9LFEB]